jgi:hypothetical protein
MTIGPAPMIRIDLMSVLFGMRLRTNGTQKKGALSRDLGPGGGLSGPRARGA